MANDNTIRRPITDDSELVERAQIYMRDEMAMPDVSGEDTPQQPNWIWQHMVVFGMSERDRVDNGRKGETDG